MVAVKKTKGNLVGKGAAGPGRPKGVPNKTTTAIKDMIVQALNNAGGVNYLTLQATDNPVAFMGLVGKVIPLQTDNQALVKIEVAWMS